MTTAVASDSILVQVVAQGAVTATDSDSALVQVVAVVLDSAAWVTDVATATGLALVTETT